MRANDVTKQQDAGVIILRNKSHVLTRVHNKNREGECLTVNAACTKSLRMLYGCL